MVHFYRLELVVLTVCKCTYFVALFILSLVLFGDVDHWHNQIDQIFNAIPFQIKIARFVIRDYDPNMYMFIVISLGISGLVIWSDCYWYTHCTSSNYNHQTYNNAAVPRLTSKGYCITSYMWWYQLQQSPFHIILAIYILLDHLNY